MLRTLRDKDEQVDKEGYSGFYVSSEEMNFLGKEVFPASFLKYVHKEEWFIESQKHLGDIKRYLKQETDVEQLKPRCL